MDRLLVILSDIEMGAGGPGDDFHHDAWLAELLDRYAAPAYADVRVDIVLNGDTFDFLKVPGLEFHPHHITVGVALGKLTLIHAAHREAFAAFGRVVQGGDRRLRFIIGNHDLELAFPEVQARIRELCGLAEDDDRVRFDGFELRIGDVHIEHGSQSDPLFAVDPERLFVEAGPRTLLAQPWGAMALMATAIPLGAELGHLDRVKPRAHVFEHLPEAKELLLNLMWEYWTRDFVRALLDGDPLKRVTWAMFREVLYRFRSGDPDVGDAAARMEARLHEPDGPRLIVLGHRHRAGWRAVAGRKILVTGAIRDEFVIDSRGRTEDVLPKVWAEAWLRGGRVVRSELREERGPTPVGVPASLDEIRPRVMELLGTDEKRRAAQHEQVEQEKLEGSPVGAAAAVAWLARLRGR